MSDMKRLANIDAMRGIASLAVCWFHMTNTYSESSSVRLSGQYGWLGIEVFFVISGFIIPYTLFKGGYQLESGWKLFILKRVIRLEPPYLFSLLLSLALWFFSSIAPGFRGQALDISYAQFFLHFGYLNGIFGYPWINPVFWTLAIEFQFYLAASFLFNLMSSKNLSLLILANFALLGTSLLLTSDVFVFHYFGLFLFGIAAYQYRVGLIDRTMLVVFLASSVFAVGTTLGLLAAFAGLTTSLLILDGAQQIGTRPLVAFGTISYSLYLLHVPIGGKVVNLGRRYIETQLGEALLSLFAVLVSVSAAYVFYRLIEKPSLGWASKFKYK